MLVDSPPRNHDHRNLVYDDAQLTVFCPECGQLWRARAWVDENSIRRVAPYRPVGAIVPDSEPFAL